MQMSLYYNLLEMVLDDSYDISPETIRKYSVSPLSESQIDLLLEDVDYSKFGYDKSKVNNSIKSTAKKSADLIKKEGLNAKTRSTVLGYISDMYDSINSCNTEVADALELSSSSSEKLRKFNKEAVAKAITLTLEVVIINTFGIIFLSLIFGAVGANIYVIAVGPLVEESAKQSAIRGGYEVEFTTVFNLYEFSSYIMRAPGNILYAGLRLGVVLMHVTTTVIQALTNNPKVQRKLGFNPDDPDSSEKCKLIGQLTGLLIHCSWNAVSVIKNDAILKMIGLN